VDDFEKEFGIEIQWTPLMMACAYGRHSIVELLLSKGAKVDIKDAAGNTAEDIAEHFGILINFKSSSNGLQKLEEQVSKLKAQNDSLETKIMELELKIEELEMNK
jgi:ankyrin repeat protein